MLTCQGCAALAAMSLRHDANRRAILAGGGACVVVNGMQLHATSLRVQRQACQALRNMVARAPELCDTGLTCTDTS